MQEQDNKRQDRTRKPRFPDRCPPVRKKRLILILLPLFLLILLLLYYKAGNHKEPDLAGQRQWESKYCPGILFH